MGSIHIAGSPICQKLKIINEPHRFRLFDSRIILNSLRLDFICWFDPRIGIYFVIMIRKDDKKVS